MTEVTHAGPAGASSSPEVFYAILGEPIPKNTTLLRTAAEYRHFRTIYPASDEYPLGNPLSHLFRKACTIFEREEDAFGVSTKADSNLASSQTTPGSASAGSAFTLPLTNHSASTHWSSTSTRPAPVRCTSMDSSSRRSER